MEGKFRLHKKAKEELVESVEWYENQQQGVGEKFLKEAVEKIEEVSKNPNKNPTFYEEFRKVSLIKFPFWIVYIIKEPITLIVSIWHKKKNPKNLNKESSKREND